MQLQKRLWGRSAMLRKTADFALRNFTDGFQHGLGVQKKKKAFNDDWGRLQTSPSGITLTVSAWLGNAEEEGVQR